MLFDVSSLRRRWLRTLTLLVAILGAGCHADEQVVAPTSGPGVPDLLVAPQHGIEQPGFAFLAPVGFWVPRAPGGDFDGSLLPLLRVEICEWTGTACRMPLVKQFAAGSGLTVVDAEYRNLYRAVWQAPSRISELGKTYRIRAFVGSTELGRADVKLVRWLTALTDGQPISGSGTIPIGAPVPIRFFVARGTVGSIGPSGGAVELAGGQVRLNLPAGAVTTTTPITAMPATDLPAGGPAVVPGTAWDFGPDGQTFARPVTMTIHYDPALLPPGVAERDLRIHKLVNGSYQQQNAGTVDLVNKTVSAQVTGFSVHVILPRVLGREVDLRGPVITSVEVLNPATGTWGPTAAFDVNAAAAPFRIRVNAQDNISGVATISVALQSPSGTRQRSCFVSGPPISGSDTQGTWECTGSFERYLEPGQWRVSSLLGFDAVRNISAYTKTDPRFDIFCSADGCVSPTPTATVIADPWDGTAPLVTGDVEVSLDLTPRSYGANVSIDVGAMARTVILRIPFTDDLAGVLPALARFDRVGGGGSNVTGPCQTIGTPLGGTLECSIFFPQLAAGGIYRLATLSVGDRTQNVRGYLVQPDGRLCTLGGTDCLGTRPEINVLSLGDASAPLLQDLEIVESGSQVTTTVVVTDALSGFNLMSLQYRSTTSSQVVACGAAAASPTPGSVSTGCTVTFNPAAASGQWVLWLTLVDAVGNQRIYTRREPDGFLCYLEPTTQLQVCGDFGDTDLSLEP